MTKSKTILIAGAGGYIGSKFVQFLLDRGYKVYAIDRYFFGDVFENIKSKSNLFVIKDDIRYLKRDILKGVDAVVNLAAISNDPACELDPKLTKLINHKGAVHLAKLAREMKVKKYILSSSCSVYGAGKEMLVETSPLAPVSHYAESKIDAEKDILKLADNNFSTTILRLATVYGLSKRRMRFDLLINTMTLYAWRDKKIFIFGGGKQWRPLVHIDDAIRAFYMVIKEKNNKKINREVFNVGSNKQNYQVIQVANLFIKYFPDLKIEQIPEDPDRRSYNVNFNKIKSILGYKVTKDVDYGILEVKRALEKGHVKEDLRTNTLKFYQYLLEAESLLSKVRLKGRLF
jgi:nucleoside-diphosphate-sugar epimerase